MEGEAEIRLIWIEHKIEDYFQQLSIETAEILSTFIMSFFTAVEGATLTLITP